MQFQDVGQCHVTIASWTEAKGRFVKQPFEDRLQQASTDFLRDPVPDGGDTQRAELTSAFIQEVTAQRQWLERAILKVTFQGGEVLDQVLFEHFDANPIDACGTTVAADRLKGGVQQR